jgi:mRNA export factor
MSLFGASNAAGTSTSNTQGDTKGDMALTNPPTDSISELAFSPEITGMNLLAVGAWDNKTRIYNITNDGKSEGLHYLDAEKPILGVTWMPVGLSVSFDNFVHLS